ncbi:MAG: NAD(P)-binding domain-containing protein [Rhodopila sp.]
MSYTPVVIIGAGQAGLAMSHCLSRNGIDHIVLERGRIAERWHSERWDSLRLLTPNWMSRLPGWSYAGNDPDGFMSAAAFADYLQAYARASQAPIRINTIVMAVRRGALGFQVETNHGTWHARAVVIATGHCDVPAIPAMASDLSRSIAQVTPSDYRNPGQLPPGGVLVVGASATGVQLAAELRQSGRPVTLAAGRHTRLPRRYRGQDIWYWLEQTGILDETTLSVRDLDRARNQPSFQLVGRPNGGTIDLSTLQADGVRLAGRLIGIAGTRVTLRDDLPATVEEAQVALERLLDRLDAFADARGAPAAKPEARRPIAVQPGPTSIELEASGIRTVLWANGFSRNYAWLKLPVLDAAGEIVHDGGVTPEPGLYALGLRFQRRRRSNFIDGVGLDAEDLAAAVSQHLAPPGCAAA